MATAKTNRLSDADSFCVVQFEMRAKYQESMGTNVRCIKRYVSIAAVIAAVRVKVSQIPLCIILWLRLFQNSSPFLLT